MVIEQIIAGVVGAAFYGFSAYAKNKSKNGQNFDWKRLGSTVVLGGIIGGVAGWQGVDYNYLVNATWVAGATVVVQKTWGWLYNNLTK